MLVSFSSVVQEYCFTLFLVRIKRDGFRCGQTQHLCYRIVRPNDSIIPLRKAPYPDLAMSCQVRIGSVVLVL